MNGHRTTRQQDAIRQKTTTTMATPDRTIPRRDEKSGISDSGFRRKVLRATFWSAVCLWGNRVITLLFIVVLARLLSPEAFGLVALSTVYVGFLTIFQEQGFGHAIIQREELDADHLNTAFWMILSFSLVLMLVSLLAAPLVGWLFREPRLPGVVRGLSPLLLVGALTCVQRALLQRQLDFCKLAIAAVVGVSAGGVVGTLAALNGLGVWSLVFHQITARACECLLIWYRSDWRPSLRWKHKHYLELFRFGKYVVGSQVVSFGQVYAADILIGLLLGTTAVGLFDVAYRCIRTILHAISGVVSKVSLPAFSRLQQQPEQGRAAFLKATGQIVLLSFPVFAAMAALTPEIVSTVFGEKWNNAVPVMRALCLVGIVQSVCYLKRSLILAYGKPKWHFRLELLSLILIVAALLLTMRAGIAAAAWGLVFATLLYYPFLGFVVSRILHFHVREYFRSLFPAFVASVVMALGILLLKGSVLASFDARWVLILVLPVAACVFLLVVWIVDPPTISRSGRYIRALWGNAACDGTQAQTP